MFTAMEMVPFGNRFLERNIRLGGFRQRDAAERAVLKRGTGYVLRDGHQDQVVSFVINGRLTLVEKT